MTAERSFWTRTLEERDDVFAELRHRDTLSDKPLPRPGGIGTERYWSIVRHEDIWSVSRRPEVFASRFGTNIDDDPPEFAGLFDSMINMDDPMHARMRALVARGFGPRQIQQITDIVERTATDVVDRAIERIGDGDGDFIEHFASPLPLTIITHMLGIPDDDHELMRSLTDRILGIGGPDDDPYQMILDAGRELYDYAQALADDRRTRPPIDDITGALLAADIEGEQLTSEEFGAFVILLVVAGNETTRTAIGHGMRALTVNPDQQRAWFEAFDRHSKTAVDEIIRWSTPVLHFRRTATRDTVLRNTEIAAGDRLVLWYCSANRDETVFAEPHRFDITRPMNPLHHGFGGGGPHFCLGANLARLEVKAMFERIARDAPKLEVGTPVLAGSDFVHGITSMPCRIN